MNTRWMQYEYLAKGLCLSIPATLAISSHNWLSSAIFAGVVALTFIVSFAWGVVKEIKARPVVGGKWAAFLFFVLLEKPARVYEGIIVGMLLGMGIVTFMGELPPRNIFLGFAAGGVLGAAFWGVRHVANKWMRWATVLLLSAVLVAFGVYWLDLESTHRAIFAAHVLMAVPLLYLLTLAGRAEESELEIGAMCVALALALWITAPERLRPVSVAIPLILYIIYTQWILQTLRVFKHILRGMSFNNLGDHRQALIAYRRAKELSPRNRMAHEGLWSVHRSMDFSTASDDPKIMELVDVDLCLQRAGQLLLKSPPGERGLAESHKLLSFVRNQRPEISPIISYWKAVAHTHEGDLDQAARELRSILETNEEDLVDEHRESVVIKAWQLALVQHKELRNLVGEPLMAEGRRIQAIASVERAIAEKAEPALSEFKEFLYRDLSEEEYLAAGDSIGSSFDYNLSLRMGSELIGDSERWERGAEFLRIAAHGLTPIAPSIYAKILQAASSAGDEDAARYASEAAKLAAREVGVKNLPEDARKAYFSIVKYLGERAYSADDHKKCIENLTLYTESPNSGLDTLRMLTEMYEKRGDVLMALHTNEKALFYDKKAKLLLERRDRYYYSITEDDLSARNELVQNTFNIEYCLRKAKSLLDLKNSGPEQWQWAAHLAGLAAAFEPGNLRAKTLSARACLRTGEQERAVQFLEDVRNSKPERFANSDEEDAWLLTNRLLGDLYLDSLNKPDQAILCFNDFRHNAKSGADTMYKMGRAYEQLGDKAKAAKCYEHVTVFSDHPLAPDAHYALQRLER